MLLTISAEISGTDLGYLLHKNPARVHSFDLTFGKAHVFYPELTEVRSQAALLLDVDPVGLVRARSQSADNSLHQYVNDRPYAASSFLSVAISRTLGTAMNGRSKERQQLADTPVPFEAMITAIPCRGAPDLLLELFEPLGYEIETKHYNLDDRFLEWGAGPYHTVHIRNTVRLQDLLTHIYVLIPVLDGEKHYWVGQDEVEKLLRRGEGWLPTHPKRDLIISRYLRYDRGLTNAALARLVGEEEHDPDEKESEHMQEEAAIEAPLKLWEHRIGAVLSALRAREAHTVLDVGCGEGKLLRPLLEDRSFTRIVGMDVSWSVLEKASRRLQLDQLPPAQKSRIELIHGSLMYKDKRLAGFDAATVIEVIEHLDPARLAVFERVLFEQARPTIVIITTPNGEYNSLFQSLPAGRFRHKDHRFEWARSEFETWCNRIAARFGYKVQFLPVGSPDSLLGPPTQMGVFER